MSKNNSNVPTFADIRRAMRDSDQPALGKPSVEQAGARRVDGSWVNFYMVTVTEREYFAGPVIGLWPNGKPRRANGEHRTVERFKSEPMAWDALCAFLSGSVVKGNPMSRLSDGAAVDLSFDDRGASQILDDGWHRYTERLSGESGFRKEMMMAV